MTTQNLLIRLAVDGAAQVRGALGGVQSGLGDLGGAASRVSASLQTVGGAFAALGVGLSVGALTGWVKGAIDAADEIGKLAQKTGLAAEQVAGLQLAFADGDVADKFQSTLSKLSAEAANGNKAFAAMGVSVTDSTGGLKSTRDLLGEVADKFAGYRDGAEKSALSQKLFGESGADLIVLLNGGSESLAEFDKTAAALGLTLSTQTVEAAGQFNDTLDLAGQTLSGVASKVAAQLLPTLNTLAGELMGAVTNSGLLIGVTNGLAFAFKGLYSIGVGVTETFRTLGTYFGGVGAAIGAFVRGDFGQINGIIADMRRDISTSLSAAGASIQRVWSDTENTVVTAAAGINGALGKTAPIVRDLTGARDAHKKAIDAEAAALKALAQALDTEAKFRQIIINDEIKQAKVLSDRMDSTREMLESIERETALMGLSNTEREQSIALFALEKAGVIAGTEAYDAYAAKIREAISARGNKQNAIDAVAAETAATAQAAKDAAAEWQKTADSINQSLTDALMRGFEDGKGFAKNLRDTLVNMFKTMVLRPIIKGVLAPLSGAMSGGAQAGQAGGDVTSLFSQMNSSVSNSVGTAFQKFATSSTGQSLGLSDVMGTDGAGASLTANGQLASQGLQMAGDAMAGYAMGSMARTMISGGYSMGKGMDNFQKVGIAVGSALGGPVVGAIIGAATGVANRLFGRKLKDTGIEGTFGGDRGFEGNNFQFLKGGMFRSDKTKRSALDEEARKGLGDAFGGMRVQVGIFASALGLNTDKIAGFTSSIKLSLKGLSEADANKKIDEALAGVGNSLAAQVLGNSGFARAGEKAGATLQRLASSLMIVNGVFDILGRTLLQTSLAGGDLASKLADAFGGLENFASATSTYYAAFYSEQERTATATRQLTETLGKLGIALPNTAAADALAQYRALVDAQNINTESGRTAYAALVTLSGGFAQLVSSTQSLGQAAADAAADAAAQAAQAADDLKSAMQSVTDTLVDEIRRIRGQLVADSGMGFASAQSQFAITTAQARAGDQAAAKLLPELSQTLLDLAQASATTLVELQRIRGQTAASLEDTSRVLAGQFGLNVPQFAVGTNYVPHDMLAQVHAGEMIVPAAYNPATSGVSGNTARLEAQIERLTAELQGLRSEVRAGVGHGAKTARILERVTPNGTALATEAAAP